MSGKVLVVDDDRDQADSLVELLTLDGWHVDAAYSARQAVDVVANGNYSAVVMDIGLPDRNGVATLASILEMRPDMIGVLMTGFSLQDLAARGLDPSDVYILTKPLNYNELNSLLDPVRQGLTP